MWSIDPIIALIIFTLMVFLFALIIWPRIGALAKYNKTRLNTKRVMIEDALKHLYDYELHHLNATINSIAGNLNVSADRSSKIIENLKNMNLVNINDQIITLTEGGRKYALRIIRVHRLWENYLAEETGVNEIDWHDEAEKVEHNMTKEDADLLSARMGNPLFDPHGDPIPSTDGKIVQNKGLLLNTIQSGEIVKIIHVEDEPKVIYQKLVDEGFFPGKELKVVGNQDDKIIIAADGEEKVLAPLTASKVSVEKISETEFQNTKIKTLIDLHPGEMGEVLIVAPNCRGQQRRRLMDFGIVPGAKISIHMNSPLSDPKAYLVKDTIVALRKGQAEKILIKD